MKPSAEKNLYKDPITITFSNLVARVHIPILEPKERERRIKKLHRASARIIEGVKNEKDF